ncbi:DUF6503 family protein [Polaribacter sp. MED152]|uniref:DUF6503 family protein n=1 Tax=Polaribacter sp. MED152 TaxID=313598 RepID=UPI000068C658|nr:DUF6503 family protein [Polaribacter sp. MED152]EAQ41414.1 hypothetical protein MED152_01830 [Polaribacter sp. MED152]
MRFLSVLFIVFLVSCKSEKVELSAQEIIDKSIIASGADKVANSEISFRFRDKKYRAVRKNGIFKLYRSFKQDSLEIDESISNTAYERLINKKPVRVVDSMITSYSNSINSVHYFSVLPFGLNDKAVYKRLLPSRTVKGISYYKIEITFDENGGGEDFNDVFIYWINQENFLIDYLAYAYETNGGGKRFRVLKEQCSVKGIRFVDYYNYKPIAKDSKLIDLDISLENNELQKVSEIILEDIEVDY